MADKVYRLKDLAAGKVAAVVVEMFRGYCVADMVNVIGE